jgi:arylsulfatase A-like enzyme
MKLLLTIFFIDLAFAAGVVADELPQRPNIILMMADDLGWGDVGFNGHTVIRTPHLDEMAKNGMRLTRFYTASPLCSPTRGSCLTGRYPWRFGVLAAHTGGMRAAEMTVAEVAHLKKYRTGFFGKWHLGWVKPEERLPRGFYSPPWQHGFDEWYVDFFCHFPCSVAIALNNRRKSSHRFKWPTFMASKELLLIDRRKCA